ncbi:MAG: hypothetical protein CMF70_10400 [Magnetovibrio sp.]|nr:hypothetical protein [Magnetovibrio sp.]
MKQRLVAIKFIAVALFLASCSEIPRPFSLDKNNNMLVHQLLLANAKPLKHSIQVSTILGITAPMNRLIPIAIAEQLQDKYLPAHFSQGTNKVENHAPPRFALNGRAKIEKNNRLIGPNVKYELAINWELAESEKSTKLNFKQNFSVPSWQWDQGSPNLISILSDDIVNKVIKALDGRRLLDFPDLRTDSYKRESSIWVTPIQSNIKNGSHVLRRAIIAALIQNGLLISETRKSAHYLLSGNFKVSSPINDSQQVEMVWKLAESTGEEIGTAVQKNTVLTGSFNQNWGPVAAIIAESAVNGIRNLIQIANQKDIKRYQQNPYQKPLPEQGLLEPNSDDRTTL